MSPMTRIMGDIFTADSLLTSTEYKETTMYTFFDDEQEERDILSFLKRVLTYAYPDANESPSIALTYVARDERISPRLQKVLENHKAEDGTYNWEEFWQDEYFPHIFMVATRQYVAGIRDLLALAGFEAKL